MKKFLSMLLALVMVASMLFGTVALAEEPAKTSSTAWLLYFASGHEKDSANFPWWPQHQRVDQPESETGVVATNAEVTGPGSYTVGLKFNWQKAEGAIQFNLILEDAEKLFPGYYVDITDIRVNGASIEVGENLYGAYHDDPESGMVSIYNSYWDPAFGGEGGPTDHRAFDGTPEDAHWLIINPDDIVNGDTIEVDFIVSDEAGKEPEVLGARPYEFVVPVEPVVEEPEMGFEIETGEETTAWLYYVSDGWWPTVEAAEGHENAISFPTTVNGEGYYTVSANIYNNQWWSPDISGVKRLGVVIEDAATTVPNLYLNVTDIQVNGESVAFDSNIGYGIVSWDLAGTGAIGDAIYATTGVDGYAAIYDIDWTNNGDDMTSLETWDGSDHTYANVDPSQFVTTGNKGVTLSISFFLSEMQNQLPGVEPPKEPEPVQYTWFSNNTAGLAGLSLKDLGIANDWHNIVPVDLTKTGWQSFPLVGGDAYQIGTAYVAVNNGAVTVSFDYLQPGLYPKSECIKWFTDLSQITAEELASIEGGLTSADVVNVATDLGGADVAYLSINNKVTFHNPMNEEGQTWPRYYRNTPTWKAHRDQLMTLMPTAE